MIKNFIELSLLDAEQIFKLLKGAKGQHYRSNFMNKIGEISNTEVSKLDSLNQRGAQSFISV